MKAIIIPEESLDRELNVLLDKLKLKRLDSKLPDAHFDAGTPLADMHRTFHYEVCLFIERLKKL